MEENIGDENRRDDAGAIGDQAARNRVARLADADRAEVQRDDVEGGVGRALEHGGEVADEGVDAVGFHGVDHHGLGGAAAERLHQRGRQRGDEVGVQAQLRDHPVEAADDEVEDAGVADHADRHQHADQVGDHRDGGLDAALGAFDEGFVDVDLLPQRGDDEAADDHHQHQVADDLGHGFDLGLVQVVRDVPDQAGDGRRHATQPAEHDAVEQVDALADGHADDAGHRRHVGRDHAGDEDVGRVVRAEDGTLRHDGQRDQGQAGGVQHQEHDLRVAGLVGIRVQGLQALHRFQAEGRGGVVEAEQVGGKIHHHVAGGRVVARHVGEDAREEGRDQPCQQVDGAGLLADIHDAQPQRHHAGQRQGDIHHAGARRVEGAVDDALEDFGVAQEQPLRQRGGEADQEKAGPDIVERHALGSTKYEGVQSIVAARRVMRKVCTAARGIVASMPSGAGVGRVAAVSSVWVFKITESPMRSLGNTMCAALLALVSGAGAAAPAPASSSKPEHVLHAFLSTGETGLDPAVASDIASLSLMENLFDPLLRYAYLARPVKLQANTVVAMPKVDDHGMTYTFQLRHGMYFSPDPAFKGARREVTAQDYVYSLSACTTRR